MRNKLCGLMTVIGLLLTTTSIWPEALLLIAYILTGLMYAGNGVSFGPLMMEVTPTESRSLYYGFTHTVIGCGVLVSGVIGGVADLIGYNGLYAVCSVFFVLASMMLWRMGRKPVTVTATGS